MGAVNGRYDDSSQGPYSGHRFPPEVIRHAIWLYLRFPLSLRMVEEMLAARGVAVSYETVHGDRGLHCSTAPVH